RAHVTASWRRSWRRAARRRGSSRSARARPRCSGSAHRMGPSLPLLARFRITSSSLRSTIWAAPDPPTASSSSSRNSVQAHAGGIMRSITSLSTIGLSLALAVALAASCGGDDVLPDPTGPTTTTVGGGEGGSGGTGGVGGMSTTTVGGGGSGPECGNDILEEGEECDDGNVIDADGCEADCTLPKCMNDI